MSKMVMVVEEPEIISKLSVMYPEDTFVFESKGPEWSRDKFNEDDAKRYSEFDILIIQKNNKDANALIKMMAPYAKREIIVLRYLYDGHINKDGDFQVVKVNESFSFREIYHSEYPWLKGYEMASQMVEGQNQKR